MTKLATWLEKQGLVARQRDDKDRRRLAIVLTDAGRNAAQEHLRPFYRTLLQATSAVPAGDRERGQPGLPPGPADAQGGQGRLGQFVV